MPERGGSHQGGELLEQQANVQQLGGRVWPDPGIGRGGRKDSVDICADAASVARLFQHSDANRRLKVRGAPISVVVSRNKMMRAFAQSIGSQPEPPTGKARDETL